MQNRKHNLINWKTFYKVILVSLTCIATALALFFLVHLFNTPHSIAALSGLIISGAVAITAIAINKAVYPTPKTGRDSMYKLFFGGLKFIVIIILAAGIFFIWTLIRNGQSGEASLFKGIGVSILIIWTCIFMAYFVWAIYFYNINRGLTEEKWDKIKQAKENKRLGNHYIEDDLREPTKNPYMGETFGLPPGTVRGMIAFTLLFGALAMLLVSIGMQNTVNPSSTFWDQYEFFKKAFLMMIAFYFGSKSLQILKSNGSGKVPDKADNDQEVTAPKAPTSPTTLTATSVPTNPPSGGIGSKISQLLHTDIFNPMDPQKDDPSDKSVATPSSSGSDGTKLTVSKTSFDPMKS